MTKPIFSSEFFWLNLSLEEVIQYYADIESEPDPEVRKEQRRHLVRNDLFYLLTAVCGRTDMLHPWLFDRCREVQAWPDGHLDLWAREHYKSTIITFGMTILTVLNDPESTVGIFSHTQAIARDFLRQIKIEFENNTELKYLFDDVLYEDPKIHAEKWSENDGITVKRQGNPKECTIEAWGLVDGMPTGRHFSHRIYDDVVTVESVTSPEKIHKTTNAWRLSDNLGKVGGVARYIGTRYNEFDTYRVIMDEKAAVLRVHASTSDGTDDTRKAVLLPPEVLADKRRKQGLYIFACQQLLNPRGDKSVGFQEEWLMEWPAEHSRGLNVGIIVDPSSGKKREKAKNDYTSIWVIGRGGDDNWYVLDMVRDRLRLTERINTVIALHRKWKPKPGLVFWEETGYAADVEFMEYRQKELNYRFAVKPLHPGIISKKERIKKLVPIFESNRIYLPPSVNKLNWEGSMVNLVKIFKEEEYLAFPVLVHDDMLDALSYIEHEDVLARWHKPKEVEQGNAATRQLQQQARAQRRKVCV